MRNYLLIIVCTLLFIHGFSQSITKADYERAASFIGSNLFNKKIFNINPQFTWAVDNSSVMFFEANPLGRTFKQFDFKTQKLSDLFDHERLAKLLSDSLKRPVKATDLPFNAVTASTKNQLNFFIAGKEYSLNTTTYTLEQKKRETPNPMEEKSPDGKWIAYNQNSNLYIRSTATGEVKQLSKDGFKDYDYASWYGWGELIEGENGIRPPHFAVRWSPDSKWIATYICDLRKGEKMYLLDWSIDSLFKPKLLSYYRGSPGDTNMVYMTPVFFNIETGEETRKDEFRNVNAAGFNWTRHPNIIQIENTVRGYQQKEVYQLDLANKTQEKIYNETSKTNIDNFRRQLFELDDRILITSEKDGWKQLYLLDIKTRELKPITKGEYYVNDVLKIDEAAGIIYFTASGKEAGRNPYLLHFYKIKLDGSGLTLLTPENTNHDVTLSPDGKYFTDNMSLLNQPTVSVLRDTKTGKIISTLTKADLSAATAMKFPLPESFNTTGRDGITTIYGAIWKPSNFDPSKKYPVIDQTYTGPHTFMYPRNIVSGIARSNQALAELGFIVVAVDGLGTANRSKAFHNVSYKNMGKNLLDHVIAIRDLGKKYSWIDTTRVGIFGHSAGGYDAGHAVLEFPDFYKVAVASSADHDFRMEKDWWPEMYMGWPVDSTYHQVSNITMAGNLKGKLLITHGGIDENVNPSATFKLAEALIKANKEFDMLIIPSQHHGYNGDYNDYFTRKKWNYFVEHLLGVKPLWDYSLKPKN